jgi:hypothetical protein
MRALGNFYFQEAERLARVRGVFVCGGGEGALMFSYAIRRGRPCLRRLRRRRARAGALPAHARARGAARAQEKGPKRK